MLKRFFNIFIQKPAQELQEDKRAQELQEDKRAWLTLNARLKLGQRLIGRK